MRICALTWCAAVQQLLDLAVRQEARVWRPGTAFLVRPSMARQSAASLELSIGRVMAARYRSGRYCVGRASHCACFALVLYRRDYRRQPQSPVASKMTLKLRNMRRRQPYLQLRGQDSFSQPHIRVCERECGGGGGGVGAFFTAQPLEECQCGAGRRSYRR